MAGFGNLSADRRRSRKLASLVLLLLAATAGAQSLYKYRGADGEWIYTDKPPVASDAAEVRDLPAGHASPAVVVTAVRTDHSLQFTANNGFPVPVEIVLALDSLHNLVAPAAGQSLRHVVAPATSQVLLELEAIEAAGDFDAGYRYVWLPGDPDAVHQPTEPYRAPFAVASAHRITQAYPLGVTHTTPDSYYAVDIEMPIGTGIYAARGGIVFEVASTNYSGGTDVARDIDHANIVRVMHDDGSQAVYAHLNWNSIRVRPGDRVERGQYIADSGNTGFTSGPHLHFAVLINRGMRINSLPIEFEGPNGSAIAPETGQMLRAY